LIATETIGLGQLAIDGGDLYWIEMRPREDGRSAIVKRDANGQTSDVLPRPYNSRTRVHEYGGGSFAVSRGVVYFSNFDDQRVYKLAPGMETPRPITPAGDRRYADGVIDPVRESMICVREDHSPTGREAVTTLVSLDLRSDNADGGRVLVSGNDFYSTPRLSPDGSRLAWLSWQHPNMPWDGTELWTAELAADGSLSAARIIAGSREESIFQPEWSPEGVLHFVSDRTGWWNLYRWLDRRVEPLCEKRAEFGLPQWVFGMSSYAFASAGRIACVYHQQDGWRLALLDPGLRRLEPIPTPYTDLYGLLASGDRVVFDAGSPTEPPCIVELDLTSRATKVVRRSALVPIDDSYLSKPDPIEFPTEHGQTAHAFFYPPRNRDFAAPPGERPPLLVFTHGGPTSASPNTLDLEIQYWTSRGIGVLDVNYGGSTGYGRAYRERLNGQWGIVDVDDCLNGARYLVNLGRADGDRLAIRGGSAGGYTTLCALTFRDTFRTGASHYGISDLEAMIKGTHKFESRYLDRLVGPYPERRDLYVQRSPIHFADRLLRPVILFQGLEDKVVPPDQAEVIVEALRQRGVPVAYLPFEGEQHGFRRAENIRRALDAELYFYGRILGFELADPVEPVSITNL
jgi:dipeptidyl aminopeptidase/acylaminoacyl peptidase